MNRTQPLPAEKAGPEVKKIYDDISKKMGRLPNIFQHMGNSPAVLEGYLHLNQAIDKTSLSPKTREQLALVVSQANNCRYCLEAHTAIGNNIGLQSQEIIQARKGESTDSKTKAILQFAHKVVTKRAEIQDSDVLELKKAGVTDKEIVEIILVITGTLFTNYFNHVTDPVSDFPPIPSLN